MNTKKLLPRAELDQGFVEKAEFMASAELEPSQSQYWASGGCTLVVFSGKAPGGVSAGAKPPEADEFSANER